MVRNHNLSNVQRITENKSSKNHSVRSDLTVNNLKALRDADISACNADKLVDLSNVKVKRKLPLNRRADDFIAQVGNPYLFRVDDVELSFVEISVSWRLCFYVFYVFCA